jgi:hypothetical protein
MWQPRPDAEIAEAGLIRLSDLGAGWVEQPRPTVIGLDDLDDLAEGIAVCKNYRRWRVRTRDLPIAKSAQFTNGTAFIQNSVWVHPKNRDAASQIRACGSRTYPMCVQAMLDERIGDVTASITEDFEGEITDVRATVTKPVRHWRSRTKFVKIDVIITIDTTAEADQRMPVRYFWLREGRAVASYAFATSAGPDPIGEEFFSTLLETNLERLQFAHLGIDTSA